MPVDISSLTIVDYPTPALREKCLPLAGVDDEVRAVARRMLEIMVEAEGLGLAAPQVGLPWRLFVCHVPEDGSRSAASEPPTATLAPQVYVNPVLRDPVAPVENATEGCLSLPEITGDVPRSRGITIDAIDLEGRPFTQTASGLLARCWQHEVDHLDGILILDRMTHLSRLRSRAAIRALERAAGVR
ncbi:MAG: peptide deformylase [Phycisphaerales bacterium]|nr:peptide deformylase [Phycisphaerales bacterium]